MDSSISDEIRECVRNGLSLECDAKLLQYMELISNKLNNRAIKTSRNLDAMCSELQRTSISLDNVTNQLSSLSHTKFVENRVYEDDETIANIKEVPVEIKTKEYNPIKTLNTVIKNNMKMLDNCYEKVSVELDDSDEEDEQIKSIVFRPKNNLETLPIPHLIGSKEWKEKWHIGIHDSDESFSENDNEEFSDGSDSLSLPSNGPTVSQSGSSALSINRNSKFNVPNKSNYYTSSDEEISTTSKTSSNETEQRNHKKLPQIPPIHEQRYYVHQPKEKGLFDESSESENEKNKIFVKQNQNLRENTVKPLRNLQQKQQIGSNIFHDEPPALDAVVEQKNKIHSKLFFDSDEGELFNKNEQTIENSAQIPVPKSDNVRKKTVNLFDDDDFNSFMEELDKKTTEKIPKAEEGNIFKNKNKDEIKPKKIIPQLDLTKNSNQNDEVIKSNENIPVAIENNILYDDETAVKINTNAFNSSDKNIVERLPDSKKVESNLCISLFEDEDDLFSPTIIPIKKILENQTVDKTISKTKITNLFDDSLPDDEFDNLFKTSSTTSENLSNSEKNLNSNNPINTENHNTLIIPPKSKSSIRLLKNIFDDDIEDEHEEFFKNPTNTSKNTFNTPKITSGNVEKISEIPSKCEKPYNADQMSSEKEGIQSLNNEEISNNLISPMKNIFTNDAENKISKISKNNIDVVKNIYTSTEILPKQSMKYGSIFNNENPISTSLFSDVAEDDDDFFKSLANTKKINKTAEEITQVIENGKKILDPELQITKNITNKNNLHDIQLNDNENSNKTNILDEQSSIKTTNKIEIPNLFSDEPPPDVAENLFKFNDIEKNSNENSNNDASDANLEKNTEILNQNYNEVNDAGLNNTPVNELENNPVLHNEYKEEISNNLEIIQENGNMKTNEDNKLEYNSNVIDESTKINHTPYLHSVFIPTIFNEIPPDDNDDIFSSLTKNNSNETEIFEASVDNFIYNKPQKSPSVSNYDSFVFEDTIPPDDNNEENTSIGNQKNDELTKTSIQSIIVDNTFSDTTTTNQKTLFNTNFIFDDEPPTDSFIYNEEKMAGEKVDSKQSELVEDKSLCVSDLIKKASTVGIYSDTGILNSKPSLEPKKLSTTNLNINVAGLIPGAKRPIMSCINKDESDGSISTKIQSSDPTAELNIDLNGKSIEKKHPAKQVSEEEFQQNILISLNKNRAQIPKKRRPSTKHGRLENYRKSLADNETEKNTEQIDNLHKNIDLNNKNRTNTNNQLNLINQSDVQSAKKSIFPITGSIDDDDWLFKTTSKSTKENIIASDVTKPRTEKNRDPLFFDGDDTDLFSQHSTKTIKKNEIHHKNSTDKIKKLTEELPNKNEQGIFQKIKIYKKKPIKKEQISTIDEKIPKFTKPIDKLKNQSIGLFDSDDDDDLFGSKSANKKLSINKNTPSIETNKKFLNVPKKTNLFNDTDDEDDDIFETKSVKTQSTAKKKIIEKPKINQSQGQSAGYNPLADLLNEK